MTEKEIDLRNLKNLETVRSSGWLITRVLGGFIYREYRGESDSMIFVPMCPDQGFAFVIKSEE